MSLDLSINEATKSVVTPNLTRDNLLHALEIEKPLSEGMTKEELMSYFGVRQDDAKKKLRLEQLIQAELKAGRIELKHNNYRLKQ